MYTADLVSASAGLAAGLRARFSLPPLHRLGLVVPDAEKAADSLEAQGVGRFLILGGSPVLWRERGEEHSPFHPSASLMGGPARLVRWSGRRSLVVHA